MGAWSALGGVTGAAGPPLGGWIVQAAGWRWVFLLNLGNPYPRRSHGVAAGAEPEGDVRIPANMHGPWAVGHVEEAFDY